MSRSPADTPAERLKPFLTCSKWRTTEADRAWEIIKSAGYTDEQAAMTFALLEAARHEITAVRFKEFKKGLAYQSRLRSDGPHQTNYLAPGSTLQNVAGDGQIASGRGAKAIKKGKKVMGDKISIGRDAVNSAVGSHARFKAGDISQYKSEVDSSALDDEVKTLLKKIAGAIESASLSDSDAEDARDDLAKFSAELEKPNKDQNRLNRLWTNLKAIAPVVSSLLSSASSVAKLIETVHH